MNKLFLITLLTFSAVWAIDTGTAGSNGTVNVSGSANAEFSYSDARDTVDLKINPMVTIDDLTRSSELEFAAPGADKATTITLSTTSNTALSVTFGAAHAAGTTSDVVLTFTNNSGLGNGSFSGASSSDPSNDASPDLTAAATKAIAFGEGQQITGVTLTGVYGANKPENTGNHTITVTATVTDDGDA